MAQPNSPAPAYFVRNALCDHARACDVMQRRAEKRIGVLWRVR
jgi:hypothetical protein